MLDEEAPHSRLSSGGEQSRYLAAVEMAGRNEGVVFGSEGEYLPRRIHELPVIVEQADRRRRLDPAPLGGIGAGAAERARVRVGIDGREPDAASAEPQRRLAAAGLIPPT
jgi:hypothetical protein